MGSKLKAAGAIGTMARKSNKKHAAGSAAAAQAAVFTAAPATVVKLDTNCGIKDAAALKDSLRAVVDIADDVVIDAGGVERLDTAIVQLLCAFVRQRALLTRKVVWRGSSPAVTEAARLLGVATVLDLPADVPAVA